MAANVGGPREGDEDLITGINVTPLVDIVLVLLIIFMVTASYIVRRSIEVELPRAARAGEATAGTLSVVLTRGGEVYLDGALQSDDGLRERVREAVGRDPAARAILSADRAASHGAVVHVIDLLRGAGVTRFAIDVQKEP